MMKCISILKDYTASSALKEEEEEEGEKKLESRERGGEQACGEDKADSWDRDERERDNTPGSQLLVYSDTYLDALKLGDFHL